MLSDRDALFAAIRANPEEDTPRLMFADWLDEHGDPDRAEFVRLQCELARFADEGGDSYAMYAFLRDRYPPGLAATDWTRIDPGVNRLVALGLRAADLLRRSNGAWLPKLPKRYKVEWSGFHRGFAHRVVLGSLQGLKQTASRLRKAVPAVTLVATDFNARIVEQFADAGLLGSICGLELRGECASGLRAFGQHPEAAGVRALAVQSEEANEFVAAIGNAPHLTGLRVLDLAGYSGPTSAIESLAGAKPLRTLKRLRLDAFGWSTDAVRVFAAGGFPELTDLRITRGGLDDAAAEALAAGPGLTQLRTLDVANNHLTGRGVTALLASPHLANVANLVLDANPCTGLDAKRLAGAKPGALRMLHFHGSRLRTADVRALARSPRLRTLWYLDLDANNVGTAAVRELVRGFGKWCPPILWLTYNRIDDRGAALLANWKAAAGLSALHLKYNHAMTEAGVRALLDSPHLTGLDALGVSVEDDELNARLRGRFRHYDAHY